MKAVVQRVRRASVSVDGRTIAQVGPGMLVLLGVATGDGPEEADRIAAKLARLRIFDDADGRINDPLGEREVLCVSQFTLLGDTSRGNRPSWGGAAPAEVAKPLYERVCDALGAARGAFGEHMVVELENDGPVTLLLEA